LTTRQNSLLIFFTLVLAIGALIIVWPQQPSNYLPGDFWPRSQGLDIPGLGHRQGFRLGLDLQGGAHLLLQADLSKVPPGVEPGSAVDGVIRVLERRINGLGVSETIVQRSGADRIIVELPGERDIERAKNVIGRTAQMDFREKVGTSQDWVPAMAVGNDGIEKPLTGQYFERARPTIDNGGRPQVSFKFNSEGAKLFGDITKRNVRKELGIFLDGQVISSPVVQEAITQGEGVINGSFTVEEANNLAIQMNAGALPVPVSIQEERTVDATLGADSVRKSVVAGEIALLVVAFFMILYYRMLGVVATSALVIYSLLVMAIFKLVPVTLTLAGIAGFILSIGMAVDANILIFERMKEELRSGKSVGAAIEAGFSRAWPSIRDSNFSTLITCVILWQFGSRFGANIVAGFAVTLAIGVLLSMFSAIVVTRSFLHVLIGRRAALNPSLFGLPTPQQPKLETVGAQGHA
jgi:preprotein translocase subunit SecD